MCRRMLVVLLLTVNPLLLTTAQYTYDYLDDNDMKCDATCGRQIGSLETRFSSVQIQLSGVYEELEEIKHALNRSAVTYASVCTSGFTAIDELSGCYQAGLRALNWNDSVDTCKSFHPKAHLIVINSAEEHTAVVNWWKNQTSSELAACSNYGFWTAGKRVDPFVWKSTTASTGYLEIPMNYTNWATDEPNNYLGTSSYIQEACLAVWPDFGYFWNDESCATNACFMCQYDA